MLEKALKRHKETATHRDLSKKEPNTFAPDLPTAQKELRRELEPEMRYGIEPKEAVVEKREVSAPSRKTTMARRQDTKVYARRSLKQFRAGNDPSDLVDTIRSNAKSQGRGFLPIARPKPDQPQVEENQEERHPEFDAPHSIELQQFGSDARTEVSEITHLTYGPHGVASHVAMPRSQYGKRDQVINLANLQEEPEEQRSRTSLLTLSRRGSAKPTSLVGQESEVTILVEKRHGLPYETTDFKIEDEESVDSWGKAIVGSHIVDAMEMHRQMAHGAQYQENLVIETHLSSPRSTSFDSPRSKFVDLVKETRAADGGLILDVSDIQDADVCQTEEDQKSNGTIILDVSEIQDQNECETEGDQEHKSNSELVTTFPQIEARSALLPATPSITSPKVSTVSSMPDITNNKSKPRGNEESKAKVTLVEQRDPVESITVSSGIESFLTSSMNLMKAVVNDIGTRLEKMELLPETEMNNMLGVLEKDLTETSNNVPDKKDVVKFIGHRFQETACEIDRTVRESAPDIDLSANSIDEMVDSVKETYKKNIVNCGLVLKEQTTAEVLTPQTFMVPDSLQTYRTPIEVSQEPDDVANPANHNFKAGIKEHPEDEKTQIAAR